MNKEPIFYMCDNGECNEISVVFSITKPKCKHCNKEMISERDILIEKLISPLSAEKKIQALAVFNKMSFEHIKLFKEFYDLNILLKIPLHEFPIGGTKAQ